jgi:hypothetical protein
MRTRTESGDERLRRHPFYRMLAHREAAGVPRLRN